WSRALPRGASRGKPRGRYLGDHSLRGASRLHEIRRPKIAAEEQRHVHAGKEIWADLHGLDRHSGKRRAGSNPNAAFRRIVAEERHGGIADEADARDSGELGAQVA